MRVKVKGIGMVEFPDKMTQAEVREVLKQFEPKKDDSIPRLLASIESMLEKQKPQIVTEPKVVQVDKQVVVPKTEIKTIQVEKVIEKLIPAKSWEFEVERDEEGLITNVRAYPNG